MKLLTGRKPQIGSEGVYSLSAKLLGLLLERRIEWYHHPHLNQAFLEIIPNTQGCGGRVSRYLELLYSPLHSLMQITELVRAFLGELIQMGCREHIYFEDRAATCTAVVFMEHATSRLIWVHFTRPESALGLILSDRRLMDWRDAQYSDLADLALQRVAPD